MYKLEFLPIAKKDISDIIYYIYYNLKNVTASEKLKNLFINSFDDILKFPYGSPIYNPIGFLNNKYRSYRVKNFLVFYTINEEEEIITIVRVLYKKMNISKILK